MRKADKFDELSSSGRLDEFDRRLTKCEDFIEKMDEVLEKAEEEEEEKAQKPKKTFGG
jgi:hypothetical protein